MLKKLFQSSTGEGLAKRWESFFTGLIPAILMFSELFNWGLVKADLTELNGYVVVIISGLITVWKAIEHVHGWYRRNVYKKLGKGKFA